MPQFVKRKHWVAILDDLKSPQHPMCAAPATLASL
jgi:hypothetical protein